MLELLIELRNDKSYSEMIYTRNGAKLLFQKKIRDKDGKNMFFINFYYFDFVNLKTEIPPRISCEIYLESEDDFTYWITIEGPSKTLKQIEDKCKMLFNTVKALNYDD